MADEKLLEFLLIRRPHVFQQKIRKSTFLSTALQKKTEVQAVNCFISSLLYFYWATVFDTDTKWSMVWEVERAFTEKEWYDNFRVSRSTFDYIAREIQDEIVRKDTPMRKAVSPRKRTAITLCYMSSTGKTEQ